MDRKAKYCERDEKRHIIHRIRRRIVIKAYILARKKQTSNTGPTSLDVDLQ